MQPSGPGPLPNAMMSAAGGLFGGFVYRAYVVGSDPVLSAVINANSALADPPARIGR